MEENSLQMNSRSYVKNRGLRGSCPLLIIHNRTIMEAEKAMLHDQDLPMHLWEEATRTTVYVHNRTPHRVLENKTPEELFSSKKPEVIHLRIFGCPVYIHIPKEKRTELDPSGKKGIFMGYSEISKAYRIYFLGYKKIEINRDVTFDEDTTYNMLGNRADPGLIL